MSDNTQDEPTEWARNIEARLNAGISVPIDEINAMLVAAGEEPVPPMTPAEAEAELFRLTGFTKAEIDEMRAQLRGRRFS